MTRELAAIAAGLLLSLLFRRPRERFMIDACPLPPPHAVRSHVPPGRLRALVRDPIDGEELFGTVLSINTFGGMPMTYSVRLDAGHAALVPASWVTLDPPERSATILAFPHRLASVRRWPGTGGAA